MSSLRPLSDPVRFLLPRRKQARLPSAVQVGALTGVKLATLGLSSPYDLETVHFVGVRRPFETAHSCDDDGLCYGPKATAKCAYGESHSAPDEDCQCGFYAFRTDVPMPAHTRPRTNQWLLEVRISGKVVVHENGYRAERQRVVSVSPPSRCACERGAPTVVVAQGRAVSALCVVCAAAAVSCDGALAIGVSRLEELLGVPVERRNLADEWLELLESGLLVRQVDPAVPVVSETAKVVRVRDAVSGGVSEIRTDRSDVLGQWLMNLLSSSGLRKGQIEVGVPSDYEPQLKR